MLVILSVYKGKEDEKRGRYGTDAEENFSFKTCLIGTNVIIKRLKDKAEL